MILGDSEMSRRIACGKGKIEFDKPYKLVLSDSEFVLTHTSQNYIECGKQWSAPGTFEAMTSGRE